MSPFPAVPFGITAIVPCFDEIECIDRCYAEIRAELERYPRREILFIDDGSTDGTLERIKSFQGADPCVQYISFARNFGLEAAFSAGFRYASMPWTVQLDADLQSRPDEMHKLVDVALGGYDIVFAIRRNRSDPWYRRAGTWLHQWVATSLLGIELPLGASVFRVARTSVARKIVTSRLSTPYFLATAPLLGARYTTVETAHSPRQGGRGKWSLSKLVDHAAELFVGFSYRPLAALYRMTALLAVIAFVLIVMAALGMGGLTALTVLADVVALSTLVLLTVVARYLIRVMRVQARESPLYQVREASIPVEPSEHLYGTELEEVS